MESPTRQFLMGGLGCVSAIAATALGAIVAFYLIVFVVPGQRLVLPRIVWALLYGIYALPGVWPLVASALVSLVVGGFAGLIVYGWFSRLGQAPAPAAMVASAAPMPVAPRVYAAPEYPDITFTETQLDAARRLLDEGAEYKRRAYAGAFQRREEWQAFLREFPLFAHLMATYQLKHGAIDPTQPLWLTHGAVAEYVQGEMD